nr:hypothetical protein [Tanacetum cinerariifolium]
QYLPLIFVNFTRVVADSHFWGGSSMADQSIIKKPLDVKDLSGFSISKSKSKLFKVSLTYVVDDIWKIIQYRQCRHTYNYNKAMFKIKNLLSIISLQLAQVKAKTLKMEGMITINKGTPNSDDETLVLEYPFHDYGHVVGKINYTHKVFNEMREQDSKIYIIDKGDVNGFTLNRYTGVAPKDVNEVKNNNNIENLVFEDVNEENDIVAQVVTNSPKIITSVLVGVEHYQTTKVK